MIAILTIGEQQFKVEVEKCELVKVEEQIFDVSPYRDKARTFDRLTLVGRLTLKTEVK